MKGFARYGQGPASEASVVPSPALGQGPGGQVCPRGSSQQAQGGLAARLRGVVSPVRAGVKPCPDPRGMCTPTDEQVVLPHRARGLAPGPCREPAARALRALPLSRLNWGRMTVAEPPPQRPRTGQREAWGCNEIHRCPYSPCVSRRHFQKGLTQHPRGALCQNARRGPGVL